MPDGKAHGRKRSRVENATLAVFFVISFATLAANGLLVLPWRITAASIALGACIVAYTVIGDRFISMTTWRKVTAGVLVAVTVAACALFWRAPAPSPPTDLSTDQTTDGVTLRWNASPDVKKVKFYRITRNGDEIWRGPETSYTDPRVQPGNKYEYSVYAVSIDGVDSVAVSLPVSTPGRSATLKPPDGLVATAVTAQSVSLAWSAVTADPKPAYSVLRNGAKLGETTEPAYVDNTVLPGQTYTYTIRTVDAAKREESGSGPPLQVSTPRAGEAAPPPPQPQAPSAPAGLRHVHSNQSSISMSWQQSAPGGSPIAGYRVYRDGGVHKMVTNLSFVDTGLPADRAFEYFVRAFDTAGRESADSTHIRMSTMPWAKAGPWTFTLKHHETLVFHGTGKPTMSRVGVGDYDIGYDRAWTQLLYYSRSGGGATPPKPDGCASAGDTGSHTAPVGAGRVYCRDEDASAGVGPISFVKCVDVTHAATDPDPYIVVEVWFEYLTP